jgi:multiple sugar transport system ATP-binding protein
LNQVRVINVWKEFSTQRRGTVQALHEVNLEIAAGSFFVLLGPSGCGKTTLLNLIAGLEKPSVGEIWIGDQLAASAKQQTFLTPRQRDIAMVFQSYALYPHMTVAENIGFPLRMAKVDRGKITERVRKVADTLGLLPLLDARPAELSGGQRQRVALGRAVVREPRLLLLDEPLSNLDAVLRVGMRAELKGIQRRIGVTTIYVTHDQAEALSMGDSIAVLSEGHVQQVGTSTQIYDEPANLFVAQFIGNPPANILSPKQVDGIRAHLGSEFDIDPSGITVAVRPEHLHITSAEEGILTGLVKMTSTMGGETLNYLEIEDKQIIVKTHETRRWKEGEKVGVRFVVGNLLLFDRNSGLRVENSLRPKGN